MIINPSQPAGVVRTQISIGDLRRKMLDAALKMRNKNPNKLLLINASDALGQLVDQLEFLKPREDK